MKMKINITPQMKKIIFSLSVSMFALLPMILAYPAPLPAYDLYTVFVEGVFGGFWLSVLGLAGIMWILLGPLGGLSQFTTIHYCIVFVYAMALGYTQPLILIAMWIALVYWFAVQVMKYWNSGSTA